ncbi:hypothetical protein MATL_G00150580 [Megalops atlanticus]|uniref:Leukemia NUP98 fusion partner 1 n=1 Tax=Megalops atlanticus TaxID=7932 RepID=A0A9D3T2Z6_MEGAT|nr:hypothetical protein MATL_G00150580 [Megalops atlanticus]
MCSASGKLYPALIVDNDEDDDGNFTKWMSSYWGHDAEEERAKERRRSFRRPTHPPADRRASLPCPSQLNAMQMKPLRPTTMAPMRAPIKSRDKTEVRPHPQARRVSSDDNSHTRSPAHNSRITTIHELSETFERRLRFRCRNVMSLSDADDLCLICHDDMRNPGNGGVREHCTHRLNKEGRRSEAGRPHSGITAAECEGPKSGDVPSCMDQEYRHPRRKLSLRRQR